MLARWPWLSLLALSACVREVENHCANQDTPDVYCANIQDVGEYCSKCVSKHYGCVADLTTIEPDCRPDGATSVADDGSTDDNASVSTSAAADDGPQTTTGESTSSADGSSSSGETGIPQPECGNGMLEPDNGENCDDPEFDHTMCGEIGLGEGMLGCNAPGTLDECKYDFSDCTATAFECHDGDIEGTEQCEDGDLAGKDCESISPNFIGGTLMCTECMFNTTGCELCHVQGEDCVEDDDCCGENAVCGLLLTNKCGGL